MRSEIKFVALVALVFALACSVSAQTPSAAHRTFRFTYAFSVREVPAGKPLSIWFPEAVSDQWQDIKIVSQTGDLPLRRTKEKQYGDAMFHAETNKADKPEYHFEVVYEVTRRERVGYRDGQFIGPATNTPKLVLARFSSSDSLVPTTGRLADLADTQVKSANADTPIKKARAIYDYVFSTMRYAKTGTGWGRGDSEWACDSKHGNCTDFHSLFASMARSQHIPTRFAIGFPLPAAKHSGSIAGYHCWADFNVDRHWVPIDISEAWKAQEKKDYFFGSHDENRVQFSVGRDITLAPPQRGKPLNYFVYPYVEVDGAEHINVRNDFSFSDLHADSPQTASKTATGN
jgi:transglutaminase-like putative cysteine protease